MGQLLAAAVVTVALAIPSVSLAQGDARTSAHPDFSGTWVLDHVERQGGGRPMGGGMGPGGGGRGGWGGGMGGRGGGRRGGMGGGRGGGERGERGERGRNPEQGGPGMEAEGAVVNITQNADRIIITPASGDGAMITYALNGTESSNPGPRGGQMKSKAKWEGAGLVVENKVSMQTPNGGRSMSMREVRSLSADGETMTVVVTSDSPMGRMIRTMTWRKRSAIG